MLAVFVALFIQAMAITIAIQISSQGRESLPLFHLGGGVIGRIVDGVIFVVVLAITFRFAKDKAFFGIFFTAGIVLGLTVEALSFIVAFIVAEGVKKNTWLNQFSTSLAGMLFVGFLLAFLIGYFFLISFLGGDNWGSRFQAFFGFYAGLSLGNFMILFLAVANWGLPEGARPKLLPFMLAFFLACAVAYILAAMIAFFQKEIKDDDKEDEVERQEERQPFVVSG
jgi:hypothetical protein